MFRDLLRRIWNRRRSRRRVQARLSVVTQDADGRPVTLQSEDIGDTGIRLTVAGVGLAALMGHREEMPFEIEMPAGETAQVEGQLVWAYRSTTGATVSGWHFTHLHEGAWQAIDGGSQEEPDVKTCTQGRKEGRAS